MKNPIATTLALFALAVPQAAMAGECLSDREVSGMMAFAIPSVLSTVTETCRPHLASDGFVALQSKAMISNYAARKDENWPLARAAFIKFGDRGDSKTKSLIGKLPDDLLKPLVEVGISSTLESDVKPAQCGNIERLLQILDRVGPQDTADLFGVVMMLAQSGGKSAKGITMCETQPPAAEVRK